jgi:hypothetical protein
LKGSGLTINQSKRIGGEHYVVVNYKADTRVTKIFVLWDAEDQFFSPRRSNTNARALLASVAAANVETLYETSRSTAIRNAKRKMIKATLPPKRRHKSA